MNNRFEYRTHVVPGVQAPNGAPGYAHPARLLQQRIKDMVFHHPEKALVAAVLAGAVVGWIIKRR
jgi:hypothetical protein